MIGTNDRLAPNSGRLSRPSAIKTGTEIPVTTLSNLVYRLNEQTIIDNISLRLSEKRIGLVGCNGSGKSTLARLICGLIKPTSGKIIVDGIDVSKDRKSAIEKVGIIFQNPDHQIIFPTVEEEIAFGLSQTGQSDSEARKEARDFLSAFGKGDWRDKPVHALSEGQKHLVCLLSVLAMKPQLIILDEPFSGPDLPTTRRLLRYLESLKEAILLITHDVSFLTGFDRIIWIDAGRILMDGAPEKVLDEFLGTMELRGQSDDFTDFAG